VRTFGDVVFIVGAVAMALQVVMGLLGKSPAKSQPLPWPERTALEGEGK
jgi:nitric oxide reductase subunit B